MQDKRAGIAKECKSYVEANLGVIGCTYKVISASYTAITVDFTLPKQLFLIN